MPIIKITSQAEWDALQESFAEGTEIQIEAKECVTVNRHPSNSSVVARGNSSVVAWGNSSVVAWDNSSVVAWGNSSVEARVIEGEAVAIPTTAVGLGVISRTVPDEEPIRK